MDQYQQIGKKPSIFTPTLLGGVLLGLLSSIPIINFLNVICCFWVLLGGFVAALLYQKDGGYLTAGQGAFLGFIAGLWGMVIATAFNALMFSFQKDTMGAEWMKMMESFNMQMPEGSMNMPAMMMENIGIFIAFTAVSWLIINSIFATLGGLLGAAILKKRNPQSPVDRNVQNHMTTEPPTFEQETEMAPFEPDEGELDDEDVAETEQKEDEENKDN